MDTLVHKKTRNMNANNGDIIEVCWHCIDDENNLRNIPFSCHYYKRATLIEVFENAGFVNVKFITLRFLPKVWLHLVKSIGIYCSIIHYFASLQLKSPNYKSHSISFGKITAA